MPPVDMAAATNPSTTAHLGCHHHLCSATTGLRASSPRCLTPPDGYSGIRCGGRGVVWCGV
eukprot:5582538-Prorocentrum_lima.AAC.1